MTRAVRDGFAHAIVAGEAPPAFPSRPSHEPDLDEDRRHAVEIGKAMSELKRLTPGAGCYFAESDFFEPHWQTAYWGPNYPSLLPVKKKSHPPDLYSVHHAAGT